MEFSKWMRLNEHTDRINIKPVKFDKNENDNLIMWFTLFGFEGNVIGPTKPIVSVVPMCDKKGLISDEDRCGVLIKTEDGKEYVTVLNKMDINTINRQTKIHPIKKSAKIDQSMSFDEPVNPKWKNQKSAKIDLS